MKKQVQQALKHYKNDGTPYAFLASRSIGQMSGMETNYYDDMTGCGGPGCGKREDELGNTKLKMCARCKDIAYCGTACQVADWEYHKKCCGKPKPKPLPSPFQRPGGFGFMNV